jgi:hypothetical protein
MDKRCLRRVSDVRVVVASAPVDGGVVGSKGSDNEIALK